MEVQARRSLLSRPAGAASLWGSLALAFLAQISFRFDWSIAAGAALHVVAMCLFARVAAPQSPSLGAQHPSLPRYLRGDGPAVFALIVIAAFFRLYRIDTQPASLWLDESLTGLNALNIIQGSPSPLWSMTPLDPWRPDWVKTSNGYLYFAAAILKTFGATYFGLKLVSSLPAVAAVAVSYFLFKAVVDRPTAFVAAFLLAVAQWHVTISRWGWDALLMSFLQVVGYWFLLRGVGSGKKACYALAGLAIGLCLYTYIASWIALAIAVLFLLWRTAADRREASVRFQELGWFVAACCVVAMPLAAHYLQHPRDLTLRIEEVSLAKGAAESAWYASLWQNIKTHGLMFHYKGDRNPRHGFPEAPALDFLTSILFVLGLALYLRRWKHSRELLILLWLALGLQGGLLSDPAESPHAYRTLMISPAVCLLAASGAMIFFRQSASTMSRFRHGPAAHTAIGILVLSAIALANFRTYFLNRPHSRAVWEEESRDGGLAALLASNRSAAQTVLVDPMLLWKSVAANTLFLAYRRGQLFELPFLTGHVLFAEERLARLDADQRLLVIFSPAFWSLMRQWFPDAAAELIRSPFEQPLYGIVRFTAGDLRDRLASIDRLRRAAAAERIAQLYLSEAAVDRETGPRRELLLRESRAGLDLAGQLRTQSR